MGSFTCQLGAFLYLYPFKFAGLLYEAQEIGNATAVELGKQREQLRDQPPTAAGSPTTSQSSQEANSNIDMGACGGASPPALSPAERYDNHPVSQLRGDPSSTYQSQRQASNPFQAQIDANLEEMCSNLSVLKMLATDLGGEIESQNELLDNMNYKIEDVDLKIHKQNKDMSKLLKK